MMIKGMNPGHAKLADWGTNHLTAVHPKEILNIGCGGGRNIGELLQRYPTARVHGVDHAALSVEKSRAYNAEAIRHSSKKTQTLFSFLSNHDTI